MLAVWNKFTSEFNVILFCEKYKWITLNKQKYPVALAPTSTDRLVVPSFKLSSIGSRTFMVAAVQGCYHNIPLVVMISISSHGHIMAIYT